VDDALLTLLSAHLAQQAEPVVLVLDNADHLASAEVMAGVDFLIRHSTPQLRVIMLGRALAAPSLRRYRLAGLVTEIHMAELAFTAEEAATLLAEQQVDLDGNRLELLVERTEGWAAGLRMAALALHGRPSCDTDRIVRRLGTDPGDVADYFVAEVLDGQPAGVQEFLRHTSIADVLTAELATALSGRDDSARLLRSLADTNTFVTASDNRYRYHPMFREVLRGQLRRRPAGQVADLHRTTAEWLLANDEPVAAVDHAAAAGDWERAALLVVEHLAVGRLLAGDGSVGLADLFERMPPDVDSAEAAIVRAALALAANDEQTSAQQLSQADAHNTGGTLPVRLGIAALEAMTAAARMDVERTVAAVTVVTGLAAELVAEGRPIPPDLLAVVLISKGEALLWSGDLPGAEDSLLDTLRAVDAAGLDHLKIRTLGQLALLHAIHGHLRQATRFAGRARQLAEQAGLTEQDRPAVVDAAFAWIHTERCDTAARRYLRSSGDCAARDDPFAAAALTVARDRHRRGSRQLPAIAPVGAPQPRWLTGNDARHDSLAAHSVAARVDTSLRAAAQELDLGRTELATQALGRALAAAAPENLRRPIVDAPPRLRRLLQHAPELAAHRSWLVGDVVEPSPEQPSEPTLIEPLTPREHEVLVNMATLLSTEEIARTMFVSVNTVKTHVRAVLRKLGVNRRNDAIRRARGLGLV
ncbi:MAG TPA: LuxR C-terminal-related transcriptional regulator, partial [Pseudonocardiaceae bacterium]|nr:LuxR C-terminal-related transcriptional regulator [Pseudonocardiaceae bacterium]